MTPLFLPVPPSANKLHEGTGRKRRKTPAYDAWREEAGWEINIQRPIPLSAKHFRVHIVANIDHGRDLDNIIKPLLDLLVHHDLVVDDAWCDSLRPDRVRDDPEIDPNKVKVWYEPV